MAGLTNSDVLSLYEAGQYADGMSRLSLLFHAATGNSDMRTHPLGRIDFAIWRLRGETIESPAQAVTACQSCSDRIEFELPKEGFLNDQPTLDHAQLTYHGNEYQLRMPCPNDIAGGILDPITLCVDAPWNDEQFRSLAEATLQEADPALGTTIDCVCSSCQQSTVLPFDPCAFFWIELEQLVKRLIADTTTLATAFGWSEYDILSMSPARRDWYLREITQ